MHAELSVREVDGRPVVEVTGPDGTVALPALWLRERSQAPDQLDLVTGQRLFDPHRLPADLALVEARLDDGALVVAFSDGHREALAVRGAARLPRRLATAARHHGRGGRTSAGHRCTTGRPWTPTRASARRCTT